MIVKPLKTIGDRIKYIRQDMLKLSRAAITDKYNLSASTLIAWETRFSKLTESAIQKCINIFAAENITVSKEWLLSGSGVSPELSFNLNKYCSTKKTHIPNDELDESLLLSREIEFFNSLSSNSIVLMISSDDMLPLYNKGDYVGGRLKYGEEIEKYIGFDCIVITPNRDHYIKRLAKDPATIGYNLHCLNYIAGVNSQPVLYDMILEAVAPIIWHRRLNF